MKLVNTNKEKELLDKHYLIPSIIAIGIIPLIMHECTYNTHLDNEEWFALGNPTATDFFLVWKQWSVFILALVCLLILLVRAKYYFEELPWDKKAFIPLCIYGILVFISACFSKKPLFAFAGGYDMFQSALAILSYLVIFYYTYTCIKSVDHVIYLLRWSSYFIMAEMIICFFQTIHLDPVNTVVGKAIISNPSRWSNLSSLHLRPSMYGTMYNVDFVAMYAPVLLPIIGGLFLIEKEKKRKIFDGILFVLLAYVSLRGSSGGKIALVGMIIIGVLIFLFRNKKLFIAGVVMLAAIIALGAVAIEKVPSLNSRFNAAWNGYNAQEETDCPIKQITTGTKSEGVTFEMKNGHKVRLTWNITSKGKLESVKAYDADDHELTVTDSDNVYQASDAEYVSDNFRVAKNEDSVLDLARVYVGDTAHYDFMMDGSRYYLYSTAGRLVTLPQKNRGKSANIFKRGFWNGRGPIYNHTIPLLKKYILIGAGADNFVMVYPQRDYVTQGFLTTSQDVNSIDVKPHSMYLQDWVQEGFIAFAAMMVFFFWYIIRCISQYHNVKKDDRLGIMGSATLLGVFAYMIAGLANDSNICTAPVFWALFGMGWGINALYTKEKS